MSCRTVSSAGGETGHHFCSNSYQLTRLSSKHGFCSRLSFDTTKFTIPSLSSQTGFLIRASTKGACPAKQAEMKAESSFYDLLGISERGTFPEIKKAYKHLARKYHPDVSPPDRVEEHTKRFIMLKEAYDTLSDPQSRAVYDRDLIGKLYDFQRFDDVGEWKNRWQSQINELKRRSMIKNHRGKASCGARMRRQTR